MTIHPAIPGGSGDAYARLVEGLQMEFGSADIGALASRIFESEKADFHWLGRVRERYLGQHQSLDGGGEEEELARIVVLNFICGRWHAALCLVDGDGCAADLLWSRSFSRREDAEEAFARAR